MEEFMDNEQNLLETGYCSASSVNGHEFISLLETQTNDFGVGLLLEIFIRTDIKQAFVSFLKTKNFENYSSSSYIDFETRLLKLLCFRRAIHCATALLNGETGLRSVDLNRGLPADPLEDEIEDNPTPLQLAAKMLCYGLTKLFIEHGADPGCEDIESRDCIPELPLNLALDALCDHKIVKGFRSGESVYKLFSLFRHQELKEPWDTIKLLASKTKQVMILGVCCVEERNLVKLAALLIVARDKLVIDDDIYSNPIAKLIGLQHGIESDLEKKEVTRSMLEAFILVGYFLKENRTISMVQVTRSMMQVQTEVTDTLCYKEHNDDHTMNKHEVIPLELANKFLTELQLNDNASDMLSADLDRLAAELLRRNEGFLETALAEKNCSNAPSSKYISTRDDLLRWAPVLRLGDKVLQETRLMKKLSSKSMITECIYFPPKTPKRDMRLDLGDYFYNRLMHAMRLDDRYEFVNVVNGVESFGSLDYKNNLPKFVRGLMFSEDSANCAAAVLAGETNAFLNFSDLTDVGWSFLHNAAKLGDPKLTALFLENGFLADDRRDCDELKIKAALPLHVALESIRDHYLLKKWKDNMSPIDLVVHLCYDEFRNLLETVRLLVLKTADVFHEFLLYFKEGKTVELCALLMVAHKELLTSLFIVDTWRSTSITQAHKELLASRYIVDTRVSTSTTQHVGGQRRHFSTSIGHNNSHEDIDLLQKKGTLLLHIFGKIGDYLSAYIRLEHLQSYCHRNSEVAWLIVRAGTSKAPVSKIANTSSRMYSADHQRVLRRINCYLVEQNCGIQLIARNTCRKQAPTSMLWKRGTSSSMLVARPLHTSVLKINADFTSLVSAKRLVDVLRRRHPPMCISIVAALTIGFRRM